MTDDELRAFLAWALPLRGLRPRGFRPVIRTVRKRLASRLGELGLATLDDYRARLEGDPAEWAVLEAICRIPVSRFYRDSAVFDVLARDVLPERAREAEGASRSVRVWSAGCASGEEPYTVALIAALGTPLSAAVEIVATDASDEMLERARRGCYRESSLRELPEPLRAGGFRREGDLWCVLDAIRALVSFRCQDLRQAMPEGPLDVVLCRYLAFNYFDEATQKEIAHAICERLYPGGALVIGALDRLPDAVPLRNRSSSIFTRPPPAPRLAGHQPADDEAPDLRGHKRLRRHEGQSKGTKA